MLHFFMTHPERVYSRAQLLDEVWGHQVFVEERTVDVHIRRLRQALEPVGLDALLETVRGVGYRFGRKLSTSAPRKNPLRAPGRPCPGRYRYDSPGRCRYNSPGRVPSSFPWSSPSLRCPSPTRG